MPKRAVIYARYSSDLQKDTSVEDQIALCIKRAKKEGYTIVGVPYTDHAISAATLKKRAGAMSLMNDAKQRKFDVIIVETLDRLARSLKDLAVMHDALSRHQVEILSNHEGFIGLQDIAIRGLMAQSFLETLARNVRRGLGGLAAKGKLIGSAPYGYRNIEGKKGEREINPDEAPIVLRIFTEYVQGRSPLAIAADLTRDGIKCRKAKAWSYQTILSGGKAHGGMIMNRLYIGESEWGRTRAVLNDNGGHSKRLASADDRLEPVQLKHLRIIPQALWDAAQEMHARRSKTSSANRRMSGRKEYLLADLLECAVCHGPMRIQVRSRDGSQRVGCSDAHSKGVCTHKRTYDVARMTKGLIDYIPRRLLDSEYLDEVTRELHKEYATQERKHKNRTNRAKAETRLREIGAELLKLMAVAAKVEVEELTSRIEALEAERRGLQQTLRVVDHETNVIQLRPALLDAYKLNVEHLHEALMNNPNAIETRMALRNVIDRIEVQPSEKGALLLDVHGRYGAFLGVDLFPARGMTAQEVLAEHGVTGFDNAKTGQAVLMQSNHGTVFLGRWEMAA